MPKSCFFCGKPASGVDHVPPKSFFPKEKDLPPGYSNARQNLITVPACDEHNSRYSKDDEVASYVVLLSADVNRLGTEQFLRKGLRAITGRRGLVSGLFPDGIAVHTLPDGRQLPTFTFDVERVDRVMERIARGLYFHDFGRRWEIELNVLADGPLMPDFSVNPYTETIERLNHDFEPVPPKGDNPDVFWYRWYGGQDEVTDTVLQMCFYEGIKYFAIPV